MLSKDGKEHCAHLTGEELKAKNIGSELLTVVMSSEEIID